jgi:hypothetical protein
MSSARYLLMRDLLRDKKDPRERAERDNKLRERAERDNKLR